MFNLFLRYVKFENLPKNDYKNLHLRQWNDLTLGINGTGRVIEEAVFFFGGGLFWSNNRFRQIQERRNRLISKNFHKIDKNPKFIKIF